MKRSQAQEAFGKLVGSSNRKALEPYIEECVGAMAYQVQQNLARTQLDAFTPIQMRLVVLEGLLMEKFGLTKDDLAQRVLDVEDSVVGLKSTDAPAKEGDLVRLSMQVRTEGMSEFSSPKLIKINRLCSALNPEIKFQTYEELETALLGAVVGTEKELDVKAPNGEKFSLRVKVNRISTPQA